MIDNSGALACLVKDYSSDRDSAKLVHTFWALVSALEIDVWFEFVYSEANIADWPSRGDLGFVGDLGAREVRAVFPPLDQWGFVCGPHVCPVQYGWGATSCEAPSPPLGGECAVFTVSAV